MVELLGIMFCYLVIILQNKPRFQECIIFILFTVQCALSYCLAYQIITDTLLWLVFNSVLDIIITLLVSFTYTSKIMTVFVVLTTLCFVWNIMSYININYYSYSLNLFMTDHYAQGMLLLVNVNRKYLNTTIKALLLGTTLL